MKYGIVTITIDCCSAEIYILKLYLTFVLIALLEVCKFYFLIRELLFIVFVRFMYIHTSRFNKKEGASISKF